MIVLYNRNIVYAEGDPIIATCDSEINSEYKYLKSKFESLFRMRMRESTSRNLAYL